MDDYFKILDLEKKYMDAIWNFLTSRSFLNDLKNIEAYIQDHYTELDRNYQIKNKLQLAAERLLSFYIFKNLNVTKVYPSPISSDSAFFTEDCLINIDSKTIDLEGNENDDRFIQISPHQISFNNIPLYSHNIAGINFNGIKLVAGLPEKEPKTNLPCLTYFMGITYRDNGLDFKISHIKLSCVPNGIIVKEKFENNLILNFKTYRYLNINTARAIGSQFVPRDPNNFDTTSRKIVHFCLSNGEIDSPTSDAYIDTTINHPFGEENYVLWKKYDSAGKYAVCLGGATARLSPETLTNREDSNNMIWKGFRTIPF